MLTWLAMVSTWMIGWMEWDASTKILFDMKECLRMVLWMELDWNVVKGSTVLENLPTEI